MSTQTITPDDETTSGKIQKLFDTGNVEGLPPTPIDSQDQTTKENTEQTEERKEENPTSEKKEEAKETEKVEDTTEEIPEEKKEIKDESKEDESKEEVKDQEEESSLDTEKKDESTSEPKEQTPIKSLDEQVSEHTSGKYKSIQELVDAADSKEPNLDDVLSPRIKKLHELDKAGANIEQVIRFQSLGVDDYDPRKEDQAKELIKLKMGIEDPRLEDFELEYEFKNKFGTPEDAYEGSDEERIAKNKLIRAAEDAKTWLQQKQKEVELPSNGQDPSNSEEIQAKKQKEFDDARKAWMGQVDESLKGFDKITFKVGEKDKEVDFDFSVTNTKSLKDGMVDINSFYKRYVNKDGSLDMGSMREDFAIIDNKETITKSLYTQGVSAGRKETVNNIDNVDNKLKPSKSQEATNYSPYQQVAKQVKEKGERV